MININKQTFTNILLLILVLLNIGLGYALWQSNKSHHPPKTDKIVKVFQEKLELSNEQIKEFQQIINEHHNYHKDINQKQIEARNNLFNLMLEEPIDSSKIQQDLMLISTSEAKKLQSLVEHYQNLKSVCTPEQQKKLYFFFKNKSQQRRQRRQNHKRRH